MVLTNCQFKTERLLVKEWYSLSLGDWDAQDLGDVVVDLLTGPVTRSLPVAWQGPYSVERARAWISDRDEEGTTLLVIDRATEEAVGLMILFETEPEESSGTEVRLGYMLSENVWGRGIASELVNAFVGWCRDQNAISCISAGVGSDNPASRRVLEKSGFHRVARPDEFIHGELLFRVKV